MPNNAPVRTNLVSVVTPARNVGQTIERTVRSVAAQTIPVRDHIIIDDGSTDDTNERVQDLLREFPHLVYIRQPYLGAGPARNAGIEHAQGRYIAFLDGDDAWAAGKLEAQISFMESEGVAFSYGDYVSCDDVTGQVLARYQFPERVAYEDLLNACLVGCLTAAYDTDALGKRYMPTVRRGQDWALWLELTRTNGPAWKYPGVQAYYTQRNGSLSSAKIRKALDMFRIYRELEQLGTVRSFWHLAQHTAHVLTKRRYALRSTPAS